MKHFIIEKKDPHSRAKAGVFTVGKHSAKTPFFMPVATKTTVKHITPKALKETKTQSIISNSFVLNLRPGLDIVNQFGTIHDFMNFHGVIFTDSGGFQMLSEQLLISIDNEGAVFKSPFDGRKMEITPELAMEIQLQLGCDVAMALDDVRHHTGEHDEMKDAMGRTHYWAKRCVVHHKKKKKEMKKEQVLFPITQGGLFKDLRKESAEFIANLDTVGIAIGGLRIGESRETFLEILNEHTQDIEKVTKGEKPVYLMGVGSPTDLIESIDMGVDMFDSRFPTMSARHGTLFTSEGILRVKRKEMRTDKTPIDKKCQCFVCKNYTRAYISHLLEEREGAGYQLASFHNIFFIQTLMENIREHIVNGTFQEFKKEFLENYKE